MWLTAYSAVIQLINKLSLICPFTHQLGIDPDLLLLFMSLMMNNKLQEHHLKTD